MLNEPFVPPPKGPIVVRLEYVLLRSDVTVEALVKCIIARPVALIRAFLLGARSGRKLKEEIASLVPLKVDVLPFDPQILSLLRDADGPVHILSSASPAYVKNISAYLGFSSALYHRADDKPWLSPLNKFGDHPGFTFIGHANADAAVWESCTQGYALRATARQKRGLRLKCAKIEFIERRQSRARFWMRSFGGRQFLQVIPAAIVAALFAGSPTEFATVALCYAALLSAIALGSFSKHLCRIDSDRQHTFHRHAPLAAGHLPIGKALKLYAILIVMSVAANIALWNTGVALPTLSVIGLQLLRPRSIGRLGISSGCGPATTLVCIFAPCLLSISFSKSLIIAQSVLAVIALVPLLLSSRRIT